MASDRVRQQGNVVRGNMAGRDINNVTIHEAPSPSETTLARLLRRLREEAAEDKTLSEYIAQLKIFTRQVENEEVAGLEDKLTAANRGDQLEMAMAMKEMIFGELKENIFSPIFQLLYASLMGKVFEEFETWVKPAIMAKASRQEIDELGLVDKG